MTSELLVFLGYLVTTRVQGLRVKDKDSIEDPRFSIKMSIFENNYQFGFKSWVRPDETDAFLVNTHLKCSPRTRIGTLNS